MQQNLVERRRNMISAQLERRAVHDSRVAAAMRSVPRVTDHGTVLASHYFHASLPGQFGEWIWFDESRAVEELPVPLDDSKAPETFPFGL